MKSYTYATFILIVVLAFAIASCDSSEPAGPIQDASAKTGNAAFHGMGKSQPIPVSGSGVFFASTQTVHSEEFTETGMIQLSSTSVQLTGDMNGWIIFHAVSVFDFENETLVNTGTQLFSGTVAGSDPVILHDDRFRFDIDLDNGETTGSVHFGRSNDAPHKGGWFECDLIVVGTGVTPEGDLLSDYSGVCVIRGNLR